MRLVDHVAAARITDLREQRGLTAEALAAHIRELATTAEWGERGTVDAHTIRRIESADHKPGIRVRFVLGHYFEVPMDEIWVPRNERVIEDSEEAYA